MDDKKKYKVIQVPSSGQHTWMGGARTLCFVYSKYHGNFILEGYHREVELFLKNNFTHYFCRFSLWHKGRERGIWYFWKEHVGIFSPSRHRKDWKYLIRRYTTGTSPLEREKIEKQSLHLKRLPKRWIPEFDRF